MEGSKLDYGSIYSHVEVFCGNSTQIAELISLND